MAGSGNDSIKVSATSDSASQNVMQIMTGNGINKVEFASASNTQADITGGIGEDDEITVSGGAGGSINGGIGSDKIIIRSTGDITLTRGLDSNVFDLAAGSHVTITDFMAGLDRIDLADLDPRDVRVR